MRYTWIDGIYVEVKTCSDCPFYSTEYELIAECQYPQGASDEHNPFQGFKDVAKDCPLRVVG